MAKKFIKRFKIKFPHLIGFPKSKRDYILKETKMGYVTFTPTGWVGLPKQIVEKNPEIYERLEDGPEPEIWDSRLSKKDLDN